MVAGVVATVVVVSGVVVTGVVVTGGVVAVLCVEPKSKKTKLFEKSEKIT